MVSNSAINPFIFLLFNSTDPKATCIARNCCPNSWNSQNRSGVFGKLKLKHSPIKSSSLLNFSSTLLVCAMMLLLNVILLFPSSPYKLDISFYLINFRLNVMRMSFRNKSINGEGRKDDNGRVCD